MASSVRANYVPPSPSATSGKRRWNGNKEAKGKHRNSKKSKLNSQFQVDLTLEDDPLVVSFQQIIKQLEIAQNLSRKRLEEYESLREENGVIKAQLDLADSEVHKLNGELKTLMEEKSILQAKLGNPATEPEIFYGVPGKFIPWRATLSLILEKIQASSQWPKIGSPTSYRGFQCTRKDN